MAIYLDQQTRPYLERLIKKQIEKSDKDFIAKRILSSLESEKQTIQECSDCEHDIRTYKGVKKMCSKCSLMFEENWTLED